MLICVCDNKLNATYDICHNHSDALDMLPIYIYSFVTNFESRILLFDIFIYLNQKDTLVEAKENNTYTYKYVYYCYVYHVT